MPELQAELFDAKLRALLSEPRAADAEATGITTMPGQPPAARHDPRPERPGPVRLWRGLVAAAALAVLATLVVLARENTADAGSARDPLAPQAPNGADGQDPRTGSPSLTQCNQWLRDLADPGKRETAIAGLGHGDATTAAFLVDWLRRVDDPSNAAATTRGALRALDRLGPCAIEDIGALLDRLRIWPARPCVELMHTFGTIAAWTEIRVDQRGMSSTTMDIDGEHKDIPDPRTASLLYRASCRLRERAAVGEDGSISALGERLQGSAFEREGALDVLLRAPALPDQLVTAVEAILLTDQPPFDGAEWTADGTLRKCEFDLQNELRDRAATILLRWRPRSLAVAAALAHRIESATLLPLERRRAALELGQWLTQRQRQNPATLERALAVLVHAATGKGRGLAGDAITALGQIGVGSPAVNRALEQLQDSNDPQLARRATAAAAAIADRQRRDRSRTGAGR
ncbi:MAG: hypothetical protein NXI31_11105 [bacterium]|nr:hypothetical protein [bacterium]